MPDTHHPTTEAPETVHRTVLRTDPDHAWLKDYPFVCVCYSLKYLADAYKRYLKEPQTEGQPRFKARHRTVPAFTIPEATRMDGDRLHVPKVGWLRLAGSNPYADCQPPTVRVRREGTEQNPKWYAYVCYAVPAKQVRQGATGEVAIGTFHVLTSNTDTVLKVKSRQPWACGPCTVPQPWACTI